MSSLHISRAEVGEGCFLGVFHRGGKTGIAVLTSLGLGRGSAAVNHCVRCYLRDLRVMRVGRSVCTVRRGGNAVRISVLKSGIRRGGIA